MDASVIVGHHHDQPILALCLIAVVVVLGAVAVTFLRRSHREHALLDAE